MLPSEVYNQRILLSCLNWGKGHVARCIGLVEQLVNQENTVIIAGDSEQIDIFKVYFPSLIFIEIPSYPFVFNGKGDFTTDLLRSRSAISTAIRLEKDLVSNLVNEHSVSLVVSDHRYGFYSENIKSIFITHQLNLPLRWWQFPAQKIHEHYMSNFHQKWVMDTEVDSIAGKLSARNNHKNVVYIGHYSRFMYTTVVPRIDKSVLICNGPKPYDEQLLLKFKGMNDIQIIASDYLCEKYPKLNIQSSINWKVVDKIISEATIIYAYCGYSTLLDAQFLKSKFELTPTKGQMEQEYLFNLRN